MTEPRASVFYDADCSFCLWCVAKLMSWDVRRTLSYRAIQYAADDELRAVPTDKRMRSWHLRTEDGQMYSAGAAFPVLLARLPGGRAAGALLRRLPAAALDRAYYAVASRRDRAGRLLTDRGRARARRRVAQRST
jgi:predicted DCC family thiol-disulfide oxidoreductase YuxK